MREDIFTWYKRPEPKPYIPDETENLAEQSYVPIRSIVKRFKEAGERLEIQEKAIYDKYIKE